MVLAVASVPVSAVAAVVVDSLVVGGDVVEVVVEFEVVAGSAVAPPLVDESVADVATPPVEFTSVLPVEAPEAHAEANSPTAKWGRSETGPAMPGHHTRASRLGARDQRPRHRPAPGGDTPFRFIIVGHDQHASYAYLGGSGTGKIDSDPPG
ncbi:hypothetical protein [Nannocystis radixulma]|uniref:Secreted protein n=1 Tax=Nannocystis radixulma TaxID=2995305 RepID=A0ABT5BHI4_9BACT|nr:hypothetical protein [Nannocystis radixulma]MDC0673557.1 hypothetical protein [Nannocystis radixulma]